MEESKYKTEKENWINRLHLTAYCRYISGDKEVANTIYQITLSNEWMNLLYNFIIKQSIFGRGGMDISHIPFLHHRTIFAIY